MTADSICKKARYEHFQGDRPQNISELIVESHEPDHAPSWRLCCRICHSRWQVVAIPYSGTYGDFEWEHL